MVAASKASLLEMVSNGVSDGDGDGDFRAGEGCSDGGTSYSARQHVVGKRFFSDQVTCMCSGVLGKSLDTLTLQVLGVRGAPGCQEGGGGGGGAEGMGQLHSRGFGRGGGGGARDQHTGYTSISRALTVPGT